MVQQNPTEGYLYQLAGLSHPLGRPERLACRRQIQAFPS